MQVSSGALTAALRQFLDVAESGIGILSGDARGLLGILIAIELVLASLWWAYEGREFLGAFIKKVLVFGFFIWIVDNYAWLLEQVVGGFAYAGSRAAGVDFSVVEDPSKIIDLGFRAVSPSLELAKNLGSSFQLFDALFTLITALVVIAGYFILAMQIFVTRIEFAIISTLGLVLLPFGVLKQTSFLAEKVFGMIVSFGVKFMVLVFVVGVSFPILSSLEMPQDPGWYDMLSLASVTLAIGILSLHAPSVAMTLLGGYPRLSSAANTVSAGLMGAGGAAVGRVAMKVKGISFKK